MLDPWSPSLAVSHCCAGPWCWPAGELCTLDAPARAPSTALLSPGPRKGRRLCRWYLERACQVVRAPEVENVLVPPLRTVTPVTRDIAIASHARHTGDSDPALGWPWVRGRNGNPPGVRWGSGPWDLPEYRVFYYYLLYAAWAAVLTAIKLTVSSWTPVHTGQGGGAWLSIDRHRWPGSVGQLRAVQRPCSRSVCHSPERQGCRGRGSPPLPAPQLPGAEASEPS